MRAPSPSTMVRSMLRTLLAVALAATLTPTVAQAATVTRDASGALDYVAAPGATNHVGLQATDHPGGVVFYTSGDPMTYPAGCTEDSMYGADVVTCEPATAIRVDLGDGDDNSYTSADIGVPVTQLGGPGADQLQGDKGPDTLDGGPGDDRLDGRDGADVLLGGDGNDAVYGDGGSDRLDGGAGDDTLRPDYYERPSADVVDGGPGTDKIESDYSNRFTDVDPPLAFTLDGGADDGRPGEGDDVRNVEKFDLSVSGTFTGTDGPEEIRLRQMLEPSNVSGRGGDDRLLTGDGPDRLDGGPGADYLDGGFGDDVLVGGPGRDTLNGDTAGGDCGPLWCKLPYGNDTIDARDGEADSVICGAGTDTVTADAIDVVSPDCETVTRTAGAGSAGSADPGTPGASKPTLKLNGRPKLRTALAKGITVKVTGASVKLVAKRGKTTVARGAGTGTVRLRFTAGAKRSLKHARSVKLTITGGGLKTTVTLRR
jgi:RTX calcium-binding nonapeptide repeat (4 copies)